MVALALAGAPGVLLGQPATSDVETVPVESSPGPRQPSSAADKATARLTATEGIQMFREQRYAEALDRLTRAQQLYDVPVHLLYIARCQRELGNLIEASETFRTLKQLELPPDAPSAFTSAVADAEREFAKLQPRVPKLLVLLAPADAPNLALSLDGQPLPSAVVGIRRPLNPGRRTLEIRADGFATERRELDVSEGEVVEVAIKLTPEAAAEASTQTAPEALPEASRGNHRSFLDGVSILVGVRLGGVVPGGQLPGAAVHPNRADPAQVRGVAGPGGEFELRAGAHFLEHWTVFAFFNAQALADRDQTYDEGATGLTPGKPGIATFGAALSGGSAKGKFGAFGEIGIGLLHAVGMPSEVFDLAGNTSAKRCDATMTTTGLATRLSGGLNIPLGTRLMHLTPYAALHIGGISEVRYDGNDCDDVATTIAVDGGPTHSTFSLGVGGDFLFGGW